MPAPTRCLTAPRSAGFTMVEVLIVVMVIGIAAALVVPMFGQTATTRLRSAAQILQSDLAYAQSESITHNADLCWVVFDTAQHRYRLSLTSAIDTPMTNRADRLPYLVVFGESRAASAAGVRIQSVSAGGDDRIRFGAYGQLDQSTDAVITLSAEGRTMAVTIDATTGDTVIGD